MENGSKAHRSLFSVLPNPQIIIRQVDIVMATKAFLRDLQTSLMPAHHGVVLERNPIVSRPQRWGFGPQPTNSL